MRKVVHISDLHFGAHLPSVAEALRKADVAHMKWQTEGAADGACADQFVNGQAVGSRFYPRCITTALWLDKSEE